MPIDYFVKQVLEAVNCSHADGFLMELCYVEKGNVPGGVSNLHQNHAGRGFSTGTEILFSRRNFFFLMLMQSIVSSYPFSSLSQKNRIIKRTVFLFLEAQDVPLALFDTPPKPPNHQPEFFPRQKTEPQIFMAISLCVCSS